MKVQASLDDLHKKFSKLSTEFQRVLAKKTSQNEDLAIEISKWIEAYIHWEPITVESNLDDIFKKIDPYYDFIDCKLILDMSETFLEDDQSSYIVDDIKSHNLKAKALCHSKTINKLRKVLDDTIGSFGNDKHNMPVIHIKVQTVWEDISIKGLKLLIKKLLPIESRQSLMKYISIRPGSVYITYPVLHCTADSLKEYTQRKLEFLRLIGIFSLYIDDHPVLQGDENANFTFELALLKAVTAGNNQAVEFLLHLKTVNINHTNEEGKTALMLACKGGCEDIVHSLLPAGANVNIQDNKGWTALMIASEHNHISIINTLLQANAVFDLRTTNGSNALIIASYQGHYEVVQLFISKKVDCKYQQKDGWNAFMLACENGHTQIVQLLLKEQVDPNVQKKDGVNALMRACASGHTQIVELLLNEKVDPNVQEKGGGNAFMLACQNGHTQIVQLLLNEKVNPNIQEKDGGNAFMLACQNGHTQIVQLLLKEQVDPNVQKKDGMNAFML
uniref:Uncharacterized protein n=1 Tax=Amphimedon queenslandica TaxID=400682 RepID=A0A1X7UC84_AMPQE